MAYKILITPSAESDLEEYASWIFQDSPMNARKWLAEAWELIFSLSEMPERFPVAPESPISGSEIRSVPHYSHRVIYRIQAEEETVEILRIWHGARRPVDSSDIRFN